MIRDLAPLSDPALHRPCASVTNISKGILSLVYDMFATMYHHKGVGLAANQIGIPLKIAVIDDNRGNVLTLINPKVVKKVGQRELYEGCLSIPGQQGLVKRCNEIVVDALDLNGTKIRVRGENSLLTQILEHEMNHLAGKLYIEDLVVISHDEIEELKKNVVR